MLTAKPLTDNGLVRLTDSVAALAQGRRGRSAAARAGLARVPVRDAGARGLGDPRQYPEGDYLYFGTATNGQRFVGSATLSHELPGAATIVSPVEESVIAPAR